MPWRPSFDNDNNSNPLQTSCYRLTYNAVNNNAAYGRNMQPEYQGALLWFDANKRHGFIECDKVGIDDVFVYETDFRFPKFRIQPGMRLLFDIKHYKDSNDQHKRKAINVIIDQWYKDEDEFKYDPDGDSWKARDTHQGFKQHVMRSKPP